MRPHRDDWLPHRRTRTARVADDARGARAAAHAPRHGRCRDGRVRHGGLVARSRCAASTRCDSPPACSPTSRAITSTSTATWSRSSRPSGGFRLLPTRRRVINIDDRRGADLVAASRRPVTYAIDAAADVRPGPLSFSLDGLSFGADAGVRASADRARRASERLQHPRGGPRWRSICRSRRSKPASGLAHVPAASGRVGPGRRRPRDRRLRAPGRRSRTCSRRRGDGAGTRGDRVRRRRSRSHGIRIGLSPRA